MEILYQIVIQERGGVGRYFISSAQNHESKTAPETKAKLHSTSVRLEFQTNYRTRSSYRYTSIYAVAALSKCTYIMDAMLET
jgi:hypothetical protein